LIRLSPSITVITRRGRPTRRPIAVAATASVGDTMAPSTKAAPHERPSTAACATAATTSIVASTSPIESREIGRTFARRSRSDAKNAAE